MKSYVSNQNMITLINAIAVAVDKKYAKKSDKETDEEITEEEVKELWDSID